MKKTILICDRCEKETPTLWDVYIPYSHTIHGVISKAFQLCPICTKEYLINSIMFFSERMLNEVGK